MLVRPSIPSRRLGSALLLGAILWSAPALADLETELLAVSCAACHGTDGSSIGAATPTIASLSPEYFVDSMIAYKTETRPSTVMGRIAKGYSDAEIDKLAEYFEGKPFERPGQAVDQAKADAGKGLAKKYCESCHEEEGKVGEGVGVLAGQRLPYMQFSVTDFLSGRRAMEKRQKQKFDALLADQGRDAFDAILHYYASVK